MIFRGPRVTSPRTADITLDGNPCSTAGSLPAVGSRAPGFRLVGADLRDVSLATYRGKTKILNILPSLDTAVCATTARAFDEKAEGRADVVVLVVPLSMMRGRGFAKDYGTLIVDGPFEGVSARAVVVIDAADRVMHAELVREIGDEPDYDAAFRSIAG